MKNYKAYIEMKFVPKEDFNFQQEDKEIEWAGRKLIDSNITITHKRTQTYFEFQNSYGDWEMLEWVKIGNPKTKCRPKASIYYDCPLDDVDVRRILEEFIALAYHGWTVKEYYLFGKYNRSFYQNNFSGKGKWTYSKTKFWDIFRIIDLLFYLRIIGKEKRIVIDGINSL